MPVPPKKAPSSRRTTSVERTGSAVGQSADPSPAGGARIHYRGARASHGRADLECHHGYLSSFSVRVSAGVWSTATLLDQVPDRNQADSARWTALCHGRRRQNRRISTLDWLGSERSPVFGNSNGSAVMGPEFLAPNGYRDRGDRPR